MTTEPPSTAATADVVVVSREDDDEVLGQVVRTESGWLPVTVFGGALGEPAAYEVAVATVRAEGLGSLAEPWWRHGEDGWERLWLLEVAADRLRVCADDPRFGAVTAEELDPALVELRRSPPQS
jgi:hypothetical protein